MLISVGLWPRLWSLLASSDHLEPTTHAHEHSAVQSGLETRTSSGYLTATPRVKVSSKQSLYELSSRGRTATVTDAELDKSSVLVGEGS